VSTGNNKQYETPEGRTLLQSAISDAETSAFKKYQMINVGSSSLWALFKYEIYTMLIAPLPGAMGYWLRKMFLSFVIGSCGRGVVIGRSVTIRHPRKIHIEPGVAVDDYAVLDAKGEDNKGIFIGENTLVGRNTVLSCKNGDIRIGRNTNIAMSCFIQSGSKVNIGNKVLFGAYCYVIGGGDHVAERTDIPIMDQGQTIKGVTIEDNVWLGADVKVTDGVTVGRDSILGAGAVVTQDVAEFSIAAGVPARIIRDRRDVDRSGES
jgi:acetyltransferase-like isoleucine patch superfamily enzyme